MVGIKIPSHKTSIYFRGFLDTAMKNISPCHFCLSHFLKIILFSKKISKTCHEFNTSMIEICGERTIYKEKLFFDIRDSTWYNMILMIDRDYITLVIKINQHFFLY